MITLNSLIDRKHRMLKEAEAERRREADQLAEKEFYACLNALNDDPTVFYRIKIEANAKRLKELKLIVRRSSWFYDTFCGDGRKTWVVSVPNKK